MEKQTAIILFRGRAGVGKTAISSAFAKEYSFPIIRKDDIYDTSSRYVEDHTLRNKISYDSLFKILESNISFGTSIILDYPFNKEEEIINFQKWCEDKKLYLVSILVICSDREVWKNRFNVRSENPLPNQIITDFDELERYYGDLNIKPLENEIVVDTVKPLDIILKQLITQVSKKN